MPAALEDVEPGDLGHDRVCAEVRLAGGALTGRHAQGVTLESAELRAVDLSGSRLAHLTATDAIFTDCDLANIAGDRADLTRVSIERSRMTGIRLTQGSLRDVTLRGCRVDLASFAGSKLERVTFEDCVMVQTDFLEAQLGSVRFHGCDLVRADLRGARLHQCEFRGSDLSGLLGIESLRGAAMEWPAIVDMAGEWAAALGIEVLDDE
jgi:uncharacterized protein YjbI with pentapeptide repeats